jgi:hypothetical protein
VPLIRSTQTTHQADRDPLHFLDPLLKHLLVVSVPDVLLTVNARPPLTRLLEGHDTWKLRELLLAPMRKPDQTIAEGVILSDNRSIIDGDIRVIVVPTRESVTGIEHSLPVMVTWNNEHFHWRDLSTHVNELYQELPAFAERLLPTRVLHLPSAIDGEFTRPVNIEKSLPAGIRIFWIGRCFT